MTRGLSRNQLKYLVILAMLIDHIAWAFVPLTSIPGQAMHFVGRLTGPVMAYFLAEGYLHTHNIKMYLARLGIFAAISWVPFSLFERGTWPTAHFGVIFSLFLGLLAICIDQDPRIAPGMRNLLVGALIVVSIFGDWPIYDVVMPVVLVRLRMSERRQWNFFLWFTLLYGALGMITTPWWSGIYNIGNILPPLMVHYAYSGRPGKRSAFHKWFFYVFYPAHLMVLYLVKLRLG